MVTGQVLGALVAIWLDGRAWSASSCGKAPDSEWAGCNTTAQHIRRERADWLACHQSLVEANKDSGFVERGGRIARHRRRPGHRFAHGRVLMADEVYSDSNPALGITQRQGMGNVRHIQARALLSQ